MRGQRALFRRGCDLDDGAVGAAPMTALLGLVEHVLAPFDVTGIVSGGSNRETD